MYMYEQSLGPQNVVNVDWKMDWIVSKSFDDSI